MTSGPVNRPFDHSTIRHQVPTWDARLGSTYCDTIISLGEREARGGTVYEESKASISKTQRQPRSPFSKSSTDDRKTATVGENSQDWHPHYDESFPMHLYCTHEHRRAERHSERNSSIQLHHLLLILIFQNSSTVRSPSCCRCSETSSQPLQGVD
jgi:hypothetical protein